MTPDASEQAAPIETAQLEGFDHTHKVGRYELSPHVGMVTNDPYVNRYLLGAAVTFHPSEVLGVELTGFWSPTLGELDYKLVPKQIITDYLQQYQISRLRYGATADLQFAPFFGRVVFGPETVALFDLYGLVGTGVVNTVDDLVALQKTQDPAAIATRNELHPTLDFGVGLRLTFTETVAIRLEWRQLSYIEVWESTTLEMKNTATVFTRVSVFLPR